MSYVQFNDVYKSYDGEEIVVKGFSMEIKKGEFVTMLGPSGSGKTTCLMMLAGFESITQGEILVNDAAINYLPPHKRNIGMVFQNYALFPHMTISENLAYPLKVRKYSKQDIEERVAHFLNMVSLPGFGNRYPNQLSGGQRQRVAVARALIFEPDIVLMDEPLGALDKNLREQMQFEIRRLHDDLGVTTMYVTHDQREALVMSDRIAVFNHGVAQQVDSPKALYESPSNIYVASFIGENNLIPAEVSSIEGEKATIKLKDAPDYPIIVRKTSHIEQVGQSCQLSIRPERIFFTDATGTEGGFENVVKGHVKELVYAGSEYLYRIEIAPDKIVSATLSNATQSRYALRGEDCYIGWNPGDCSALSR